MKKVSQFAVIILLIFTHVVSAGVFLKQKRHTDAMQIMGQNQPAKDLIEEIWLTEAGFRSDNDEQSVIYDASKKIMIMVNHQSKSYVEMPMGKNMLSDMMGDKGGEDTAELQNMMQNMMKIEITVVSTSEQKTIHGWPCKKYNMTMNMAMGQSQTEIWASEKLKVDSKLYQQFSASMFSMIPGMQQAASQVEKEMGKIMGVQVLNISSTQVMGQTMQSKTELLEFKEGKAPANLLQIPSGYTKQSFQGM